MGEGEGTLIFRYWGLRSDKILEKNNIVLHDISRCTIIYFVLDLFNCACKSSAHVKCAEGSFSDLICGSLFTPVRKG
jgi:hypothetical protein